MKIFKIALNNGERPNTYAHAECLNGGATLCGIVQDEWKIDDYEDRITCPECLSQIKYACSYRENKNGWVNAQGLLKVLWPYEDSRPSLRWIREMQSNRVIPYYKLGRCVYFDPIEVRRSLAAHYRINAFGE